MTATSAITGIALGANQALHGAGVTAGTNITAIATTTGTVAGRRRSPVLSLSHFPKHLRLSVATSPAQELLTSLVSPLMIPVRRRAAFAETNATITAGQLLTYDTGSHTVNIPQRASSTAMTVESLGESTIRRPSCINYAKTAGQYQWIGMYDHFTVDQGAAWMNFKNSVGERSNATGQFVEGPAAIFPSGTGTREFRVNTPMIQLLGTSTGVTPTSNLTINPNLAVGAMTIVFKDWDVQTVASPVFSY